MAREAAWLRVESCSAGADKVLLAYRVDVRLCRFGQTREGKADGWGWKVGTEARELEDGGSANALKARFATRAWVVNGADPFDRERGEAVRGADDDGSQDLAEHQVF